MVSPNLPLKTENRIKAQVARVLDGTLFDLEAYAYVLLYQTTKELKEFVEQSKYSTNEILNKALSVLSEKDTVANQQAKEISDYLLKHISDLSEPDVSAVIELLSKKNPAGAKKLESKTEVQVLLGNSKEHSIEKYVREKMPSQAADLSILTAVKTGVPYADGSGISSRNAVVFILLQYAILYEQSSQDQAGEMTSVSMLKSGYTIEPCEEADTVARALDQKVLSDWLMKYANTTKYRSFLLSCSRYATEKNVQELVKMINSHRRGKQVKKLLNAAIAALDMLTVQHQISKDQ